MTANNVHGRRLFITHSSSDNAWARRIESVLSSEGYECFLDFDVDKGFYPGEEWEAQLFQRIHEASAIVVLGSQEWLQRPWCVAEAIVGRHLGKTLIALDLTKYQSERRTADEDPGLVLRDVLPWFGTEQTVEVVGTHDETGDESMLRGLRELVGTTTSLPATPYVGLEPFDVQHAPIFFGRDDEINALVGRLDAPKAAGSNHFIVVVGASGSGKSSVVRAGVVPQLLNPSHHRPWIVLEPISAQTGIRGLARSLAKGPLRDDTATDVSADVDHGENTTGELRKALVETLRGPGVHETAQLLLDTLDGLAVGAKTVTPDFLIVLDQLEQVLRHHERSSARDLLAVLVQAANDPSGMLTVLATLRSDALDEFQRVEVFAKRWTAVTLDPMPRSKFSEVIEKPAEAFNLRLEAGLAQRLIEDTQFEDALPLLSVTLQKLYEAGHDDGLLEISEYERLFAPVTVKTSQGGTRTIKGVAASITTEAEAALEAAGVGPSPSPEQDAQLRDLFLRLVVTTDEDQPRARVVRLDDLPSAGRVVNEFVNRHLLVKKSSEGHAALAVTHEALFRVWDRYRRWIEESRDALVVRERVARAAKAWDSKDRDEARRWPDSRVVDVARMLVEGGIPIDSLTEVEQDFLGPLDQAGVIANLEDDTLGLVNRAALGYRLNLLGDNRPGVGIDDAGTPSLSWLPVGGGSVTLGIPNPGHWKPLAEEVSRMSGASVPDPGAGLARRNLPSDYLTREVAPFLVSAYPVTCAQFEAFVRAEEADSDEWWDGLVRSDRFHERPSLPDNYPATHLTWHEAAAFCRWLSARISRPVRLPDEFEWQQAATGGKDILFPWGQELPNKGCDRANTFGARGGAGTYLAPTTTAVGIYPRGAAPTGALDMAGNCWEWCDSDFEPAEVRTGESARVVRGGSWVIRFPLCTTKYTGQLDACASEYFVGFRPVTDQLREPTPQSTEGS